jgi:hypothetical protein
MVAPKPPTGAGPQQIQQVYHLSEQTEFEQPACPMNCNACNSWSCPGQRRLSNYDSTFNAIIGIGTLGGGFTFTVIFSTLDTRNGTITTGVIDRSRHFLIVAWVLFILAVIGAAILGFHCRVGARNLIEQFDRFESRVIIATATCLDALQLLILAAFLMSAKALEPYDKDAAQAAIILVFIAGGALILMWLANIW